MNSHNVGSDTPRYEDKISAWISTQGDEPQR